MTITTKSPTEATLEARVNATLQRVFAGVLDLRHQLKFKIRIGRSEFHVGSDNYIEGRADIIVFQGDAPLAVIELKKEGLPLTEDDEQQGRSYAIWSQTPIVVVTNGTDTRIFQTHDMTKLDMASIDGEEVSRRIQSAATAAQSAVNSAINKLLGKSLATDAVRALSNSELNELTGDWAEGNRFVEGFLISRKATAEVKEHIKHSGKRAVLVSGTPLSGKSNVLRELALDGETDGNDVLYLDGSACSEGVFRRFANLLAAQFSWPASADDARQWLRQLSNRTERKTILCIDSPQLTNVVFRGELDELISKHFGSQLIIIMAVDEYEVDAIRMLANLREKSKFGKKSVVVTVENYDDKEFVSARENLEELGGRFVHGAQFSQELRAPWVLRALAASILIRRNQHEFPQNDYQMILPPMLGWEVLDFADQQFKSLDDTRDDFARMAKLYVESCEHKKKPLDMLASIYIFSLPVDIVKESMGRYEIQRLVRFGLVKKGKAPSGESIYVVRAPELFGYEIAMILAKRLTKRLQKDPDLAATWFVRVCSRIPLGDSIGARAIGCLLKDGGIRIMLDLINRLFANPPVRENIPRGSEMMMMYPNVGAVYFHLDDDGKLIMRHGRNSSDPIMIDTDGEDMVRIAHLDPWMILSQLRAYDVAVVLEDGNEVNFAADLVFLLASCPIVLRKPGKEIDEYHVHTFDGIEMSCHQNGMVEPVTWSIAELLSNESIQGIDRDGWVLKAFTSDCHPLINRFRQALAHMSEVAGRDEWAKRKLDEHCLLVPKTMVNPH